MKIHISYAKLQWMIRRNNLCKLAKSFLYVIFIKQLAILAHPATLNLAGSVLIT